MPAMTSDEAYAILGVQKTANEIEIKTAYKRLALRTHPDKNPNDPDASKNFHRVSEAYKRITDPASFHDEDNDGEDISDAEAEMMFNMMFSEMFGGDGFVGSSDFFGCDDDYIDDDDDDYGYDDDEARPRGWRAEENLLRAMAMMMVGAKDCGDDDSEDEEYCDEDDDDDEDEDEDDDEDDDDEDETNIHICEKDMIRMMIQNLSIGQDVQKKTANGNLKSENLDTVKTVYCGGRLSGQKGKESSSRGFGRMMGGDMGEVAAMFQMMETMENANGNHSSKLGTNFKTRSKRKIDEEEDSDDWETADDDDDDDDDDDEDEDEDEKEEEVKEEEDKNKKIGVQHKPFKSSTKIPKAALSGTGSSSSFFSSSKATAQKSMIDESIVKGMSKACSVSEGFKVGDRVMVNSRLLFSRSATF